MLSRVKCSQRYRVVAWPWLWCNLDFCHVLEEKGKFALLECVTVILPPAVREKHNRAATGEKQVLLRRESQKKPHKVNLKNIQETK